jgi:hypothetical protein
MVVAKYCFGAAARYQSEPGPKGTSANGHSMCCAIWWLQPANAERIQAEDETSPVSENPLANITIFTRDINLTAEISWR